MSQAISVVLALMNLRQVDLDTLAKFSNVSSRSLEAWLRSDGQGEEASLLAEAEQREVLRLLGVEQGRPIGTVVHYWRVAEPLFGRRARTYAALEHLTRSFGRAEVLFLARESDPSMSSRALTRFALQFEGFVAILEITSHALRGLAFDPAAMANLSWLPDSAGLVLDEQEYDQMGPGSLTTGELTKCLLLTSEAPAWERLRDSALEQGIRVEEAAEMLAQSYTQRRLAMDEPKPEEDAPAGVATSATPSSDAGAQVFSFHPTASQPSAYSFQSTVGPTDSGAPRRVDTPEERARKDLTAALR